MKPDTFDLRGDSHQRAGDDLDTAEVYDPFQPLQVEVCFQRHEAEKQGIDLRSLTVLLGLSLSRRYLLGAIRLKDLNTREK